MDIATARAAGWRFETAAATFSPSRSSRSRSSRRLETESLHDESLTLSLSLSLSLSSTQAVKNKERKLKGLEEEDSEEEVSKALTNRKQKRKERERRRGGRKFFFSLSLLSPFFVFSFFFKKGATRHECACIKCVRSFIRCVCSLLTSRYLGLHSCGAASVKRHGVDAFAKNLFLPSSWTSFFFFFYFLRSFG